MLASKVITKEKRACVWMNRSPRLAFFFFNLRFHFHCIVTKKNFTFDAYPDQNDCKYKCFRIIGQANYVECVIYIRDNDPKISRYLLFFTNDQQNEKVFFYYNPDLS